ncbi:MAG: guanylyl cyclase [marine bacterium B5-7]|nr:MAG: guanylyl cyclase [marine bacterium B5-7]
MAFGRPASKFAFILHADVAGSTAMVHQDEHLAHERIQSAFNLLSRAISSYGGVTLEIRGDALLAEFEKASDAICAALVFQQNNVSERETSENNTPWPRIRIGIAMGEVIVADRTVTGAGVVLAQRFEQLAEPDCVVMQGAARESLPERLPLEYSYLGEKEVKGFERPISAYQISIQAGENVPKPDSPGRFFRFGRWRFTSSLRSRPGVAGVAIAAVIAVVLAIIWWQPWHSTFTPASVSQMSHPLPDRPSLAVLPLKNLGNDADQDYLGEELAANLARDLTRSSNLFVIDPDSSSRYTASSVKHRRIAEELGVGNVLEGTVSRDYEFLEITLQLTDVIEGKSLWSTRFKEPLNDVFAQFGEIVDQVVITLVGPVSEGKSENETRQHRTPTTDASALDNYLRGLSYLNANNAADNARGRELFLRALDRDPDFADAHAALALSYLNDVRYRWTDTPEPTLAQARQTVDKALALDPLLAQGNLAAGYIALQQMKIAEAITSARKALSTNPGLADAYALLGTATTLSGNAKEGVELLEKAIRINPFAPYSYEMNLGRALFFDGSVIDAQAHLRRAIELNPGLADAHIYLTAALGAADDHDAAIVEGKQVISIEPDFRISNWLTREQGIESSYRDKLRVALKKAGLPDTRKESNPQVPDTETGRK